MERPTKQVMKAHKHCLPKPGGRTQRQGKEEKFEEQFKSQVTWNLSSWFFCVGPVVGSAGAFVGGEETEQAKS